MHVPTPTSVATIVSSIHRQEAQISAVMPLVHSRALCFRYGSDRIVGYFECGTRAQVG